ncbi:UNVERIFIED_CONTAM: hypothetical protein PYX00_000352 [Menopon gallinae]|uniref:DNA replication ATP-dependent helicase/nuclease n=1 Tax=Menopon gallinae TaxID=328185 RepID=A0AAW2IAT6_9NEOP
MKQSKISSFFVPKDGKRKRPDDEAASSASSRKMKKIAEGKTGKATREKIVGIHDKENGLKKPPPPSTVGGRTPEKVVLSPKKLQENIILESPDKFIGRNLQEDFDKLFDEPMLAEVEEYEWHSKKSQLSLSKPTCCRVVRFMLAHSPSEQIVLVRAEGTKDEAVCRLRDMWMMISLTVNEAVTVLAKSFDGQWVINAQNGYLIIRPDVMMPITSLVNGMFCLRRGVLSHLYKSVTGDKPVMLMGRVLHELLQESLKKNLDDAESVEKEAKDIVNSRTYLREFYLSGVKLEDVYKEVKLFIPKIVNFVKMYVKGDVPDVRNGFRGRIVEVTDIEQAVSSRRLGIQGRVDATVKIHKNGRKESVPMELKMGMASFSMEHKIQVMMYTLLLDELLSNVRSGLLLYLREELIQEIEPKFEDVRNFMMLRNEFVKHVSSADYHTLPEPIRSKSCLNCPHARLCFSYLKNDGLENLSANHPMKDMNFPDLQETHINYFNEWTRMLFLECSSQDVVIEDAFVNGEENITQVGDDFEHVFQVMQKEKSVQPGCMVTIFRQSLGVSHGKVISVTDSTITVLNNKKLEPKEVCKIVSTSRHFLHNYLSNLAFFLDEKYQRLRELIVDRTLPRSDSTVEKKILTEQTMRILHPLNKEQQRAVLQTVASSEYLLIKGPPGTGKTETIVALIKFLNLQKQRILITGHTNASIDHILLKLDGVEYVRFGSLAGVNRNVHPRTFVRLLEKCENIEDVQKLYECGVMASTCISLDLEALRKVSFDICVIDESSQVMQVEAIRPLLFCKKFVLIGDANQLPPVVKKPDARKMGMDVSIFERLEREETTICLSRQYRMNRVLNDLANSLTYNGLLQCGSDSVANATLNATIRSKIWVEEILSPEMDMSVVFVDTSEYFDDQTLAEPTQTNVIEASIVALLLGELLRHGVSEDDIGVIAPFVSQVNSLKRKLQGSVEVSTVDQFQGKDKKVIFFSCTRHSRDTYVDSRHVLNDHRRLTVAVTRAKVKLVLVGDMKSMTAYSPMQKLISCLKDNQIIRLKNGENDFTWDDLLKESSSQFLISR